MFDTETLATRYGEPYDFAALQARADELIAYIRQPIATGDPGLIEAAARLHELDARVALFFPADLPFAVAKRIEDQITDPLWSTAADVLNRLIERRAPEGLPGCIVKLQHAIAFDADRRSLKQILACIEREARR